MALKPRASNTIILNIDERLMSRECKLALERSWAYVGDTLVRTHSAPEDTEPVNFIHVMIKFGTRNYLFSSSSEDADANWRDGIEHHLANTVFKIGHNNKIFNRNQRNHAGVQVDFEYLELELERGLLTIRYRLDSNGDIPRDCAFIATDIRKALNEGTCGDDVVRVDVPSEESYRLQAQAAQKAKEKAEAEEAARKAQEQAEKEAATKGSPEEKSEDADSFLESPELVEATKLSDEAAQEDADAEAADADAADADVESTQADEEKKDPRKAYEIPPMTPEEWQANYGFDEADFAIDYHIWDIVYQDGTQRAFDSKVQQFLDDENYSGDAFSALEDAQESDEAAVVDAETDAQDATGNAEASDVAGSGVRDETV